MQNSVVQCRRVSQFLCFLNGLDEGRRQLCRSFGHEHDFCQDEKAENTDARTVPALKYAAAHGHFIYSRSSLKSPSSTGDFEVTRSFQDCASDLWETSQWKKDSSPRCMRTCMLFCTIISLGVLSASQLSGENLGQSKSKLFANPFARRIPN